ncbi:MAG TPA: HTTM domain-containing protein [Urbifossiella sp.]|jgi:hypothetical protein|nr:HTTM domain-containing protein [Urbifossiella sp.]
MTPAPRFVGTQPWFPGALGRWPWLTAPVPAERVAAFRIAVAAAVLCDIFLGYLPHSAAVFSPDALGGRDLYQARFGGGNFYWSVLRWLPDGWGPVALFAVWVGAAVGLLVGWRPLLTGLVVWACAVSVWNINPGLANAGDRLRHTLILAAAVSRSGAVWGVSSVRRGGAAGPVLVPGWPVRVVFVQLAVLYFFSGVYKIANPTWRAGYVMYFVAHDLGWSLAPAWAGLAPVGVYQLASWLTLVWELGFPVLAVLRGTRVPTLWVGFIFHLLTLATLEVGAFALYGMAAYAAFVPWERWPRRAAR